MIRRLTRSILVFALLSALLAGLFFRLSGGEGRQGGDSLQLSQREPTDIERIDITNSQGTYAIRYDSENGGYVIGDLPADLVDMDRFIALMVSCAGLSAASRVEAGQPAAAWGLAPPQGKCLITFDDGVRLDLSLGAQVPVSGDYYLQVAGREAIFTLGKAAAEPLLANQSALLSRQVTPPLQVSSPLSAVRDAHFSGARLPFPLSITSVMGGDSGVRLQALSFGAATHLVRGAGLHELDQAGGIRVLGSLLGIQAVDILGYNLSDEELAAYGFSDPDLKAAFTLAGAAGTQGPISLLLVQADEDRFYAAVAGRPVVYLIDRPAFYDLRYEDLIMRYFISPMLVDVKGLTVRTPEAVYEISYEKTDSGETRVTLNGAPVAPEQFMIFYRLATSAAADGPLREGVKAQGTPALSISYHYKSQDKPDDVLRFFPGTARRMDVEVNGVIELDIRESFITRMAAACRALKEGSRIEEVW
ncbi:MAG: DUF4340 domain-containing protein [Christensenellales bacterium]